MKLIKNSNYEIITLTEFLNGVNNDGIELSLPSNIKDVDLSEFGVSIVRSSLPPETSINEVAYNTEEIEIINGEFYEKWAIREKTEEEFNTDKESLKLAVEASLANAFANGFTVPFGTLQGQVLQTRNLEDRTNWLTSQAAYSAAIMGGQGAVEGAAFRTVSNETFTVTYQEGFNILLVMADWGKTIMGISWNLKDQIKNASNYDELLAIDLEGPWS